MPTFIEARPNAAALIESMRDIGYSLQTAIADIIDNSITAKARRIEILTHFAGPDSAIGILDDGLGMSHAKLIEAMRPGSRSPTEERDEGDLGRFGLGLKTASYSQCRRVTVSSRQSGVTSIARWDIDHVVSRNDWSLELIPPRPGLRWLERLPENGTLVVWDRLDRVLGEEFTATEAEFNRAIGEVRTHLSLVFHRFLLGSNRARRIKILLNGTALEGFDPFFITKSTFGPEEPFLIGNHQVSLRTYTLPHYSSLTPEEWKHYGGEEGYLKNQGFYVFRGNRLIIHGTWFGLMKQAELTKLTRVAVNLPNRLDADWKIDVKKASAQPPPKLRRRLRQLTEHLSQNSRRVFKGRGVRQTSKEAFPVWARHQHRGQISYRIDESHPMVVDVLDHLNEDAGTRVRALLALISATLPLSALHHDVSSDPERIVPGQLSDSDLKLAASALAQDLIERLDDPQLVMEMMRQVDPFRSDWDRTLLLLRPVISSWDYTHE